MSTVAQHVNFAGIRLSVARGAADDPASATGPIELEGLALPWGQTVQMNWWGDTVEFSRGSVMPAQASRVKFLLDHRAHGIGYGLEFTDRPEGLWARMAIPRDELDDVDTARAFRQMGNGIRDALSVGVTLDKAEVNPSKGADADHYVVTAGTLLELSSVLLPRFDDARVARIAAQALRAQDDEQPDHPDDDDEDEDDTDDAAGADDEGDDTVTDTADTLDNRRRARVSADVDEDERAARHRATVGGARTSARADRFASFGAYALARLRGEVDDTYQRRVDAALVDVTTTDIAGIVPEQWMRDVIDLMGAMAPTVAAFSTRPLPTAGMTINVPKITARPIVGKVAGEKIDIPSRKTTIVPAPFLVNTYAGGEDISIQALLRSDPSYLDEVMRLYAGEMARVMNVDALRFVLTDATAGPAWPADVKLINAAFVDAAVPILNALYRFPEVAILSATAWAAMGKAVDTEGRPLFPTVGLWNPVGTFAVTDATGNVRGLTYYVDPSIGSDWAIVGVRDAFRTMLGPVGTLTADVPAKLGRDVAVYRFAAMGVTDAAGIVRIGALPAAQEEAAPASSTAKKAASS